jgi:hypothetical protein
MVGDEIVVEGSGVDTGTVEAAIRRHLGLPEPPPEKTAFFQRLFRR